jgi:hypothetical protein
MQTVNCPVSAFPSRVRSSELKETLGCGPPRLRPRGEGALDGGCFSRVTVGRIGLEGAALSNVMLFAGLELDESQGV